ncbi:MAG TPA: alpha/beta fold hydrolase [Anaerolineales bacterium]|nr:alpha/beta fold hydrolase [Anaerolineales bacterium]
MNAAYIFLVIAAGMLAACSAVGTTPTPLPEPSATPASPPTQTQIPSDTVTFTTEDGVRLAGTFRGEGKMAVILAHQGTPHADQTTWATFADVLAEHGIASLAFDFRGIGRSGGTFLAADLDKDVLAATQYLRGRGYDKIVCGGASMGGTACMSAAQHEAYVGLIILASGMSAGTRQYGLHLTEDEISSLVPPKLFITAEGDYGVINDMRHMSDLAPDPKQLVLLPGTKHGTDLFNTDAGPALTKALLVFIEALQDGTPTATSETGDSVSQLKVITPANAASIELLNTLEIPEFRRASLSQCSVAFSPDEESLGGVCQINALPVWNAADATLIRQLESTPVQEVALTFSPDGEQLATGGMAKEIRLWDAVSGEYIDSIGPLPAPIWDLAFSPDGATIASASVDLSGGSNEPGVHLWDVKRRELLWEYDAGTTPLRALSLDFAPDGKTLAVGTFDSVLILDAKSGELQETLPMPSHVGDLSFSPDGDVLAAGCDDNKIWLWDPYDFRHLRTLEGHGGYVNGVAFTPDASVLISGGHDRQVGVWDVESGRLLTMLDGHEGPILRVAVNPLGTLIASISWDGTVRLWGTRK